MAAVPVGLTGKVWLRSDDFKCFLFIAAVEPNQEEELASMRPVASRLAEEIMEKVAVVEVDEAGAVFINHYPYLFELRIGVCHSCCG
ncbi:MAG: hypothetical protein GY820_02370 [Gammaproteobacteria bacterium]|nr:hypothetical protein [Gammaproteobacteria bacterium]